MPSETDDVIDSRDVIERIDALTEQHDAYYSGETGAEWTDDDAGELATLEHLARQGESLEDWHHGCTLVRETYFTEYARELAYDIAAVSSRDSWPLNCIDWELAARELQVYYTDLDYNGITYYAS